MRNLAVLIRDILRTRRTSSRTIDHFRSTAARLISIVAAPLLLTACAATFEGFPDRVVDPDKEVAANIRESDAQVAKYRELSASASDEEMRTIRRNSAVMQRLSAVNIKFSQFEKALFIEGVGSGVATDWVALAINAAGTVTGTAALKSALHATSVGLLGAKAAFDKNAYWDKTLPVLVGQMYASRKAIEAKIRSGLVRPDREYPLDVALMDVEQYYVAGTIPGALLAIAESSGASAKKSEEEITQIVKFAYFPDEIRDKLSKWMFFDRGNLTDSEKADATKRRKEFDDFISKEAPGVLPQSALREPQYKYLRERAAQKFL
ncbi:MAG: hypothetical protein SFV19_13565 [Rhodospirillaceae bacterium]|nr:hypothetical protein [Rhodospirillaceae bacterium]